MVQTPFPAWCARSSRACIAGVTLLIAVAGCAARVDLPPSSELWSDGRFAELETACVRHAAARECPVHQANLALLNNRPLEALRHLDAFDAREDERRRIWAARAEAHYRLGNAQAASHAFREAGREAMAMKLASFGKRRLYAIDAPIARTVIAFAQTDPLPIVELAVNGEKGFFILDTGGGELIVDPTFAVRLALPAFGAEGGLFGGGTRAQVGHARAETVVLGGFTVRNVPVSTLDTRKFALVAGGRQVAGVLGTQLLARFRTTLDYPRGRLILELPDSAMERASDVVTLPMWLAGDHFILVRGRIGAAPEALMFIDTGLAGPMFAAPESTLMQAGIAASGASYEGFSGGGPIKVTPVEAESISLGPIQARNVMGLARAFPPTLEHRFGFRIGGLISHGFLRPYAVTFDFERMEMTFARDSP